MRAAALLALAGCNQIFGLNDPVSLVDGPVVPPDAAFPTVKLTHLVAQTRVPAPNAKAVPDPVLRRPALVDPMVKVGPLAGPLADASYDTTTGEVTIPPQLFDSTEPWRLQYRVDGVPHDVYWTTSRDNATKLVVPVFGRLERTAPPADSGYDIQPTGLTPPPPTPNNYRASRVFTTGVFMDILANTSPSNTRVDTTTNKHVSGPLGTPDATLGDAGTLANYRSQASCEHLVDGYADFFVPALSGGTRQVPLGGALQPAQPQWSTNQTVTENAEVQTSNSGTFGPGVRLGDALDDRSDDTLDPDLFQTGFAASELIPIHTPERPISFLKSNVLTLRRPPGPLMFLLAQCTLGTTSSGGFHVPQGLEPFPRITYGVATNRRSVGGVELLSSIVTASKATADIFVLDFGVPLAIAPITISDGIVTVPLSDTVDVSLGAATTLELDFTLEPDTGTVISSVDYVELTVFRLDGALIPIHVYVTANLVKDADGSLATPIRIDGSELVPGGVYVFQIRTVRGAPRAALGDFEAIAFPQAMATIFTRTLTVL